MLVRIVKAWSENEVLLFLVGVDVTHVSPPALQEEPSPHCHVNSFLVTNGAIEIVITKISKDKKVDSEASIRNVSGALGYNFIKKGT